MANNEQSGAWKTIRGARVFIRDGESVEDALIRGAEEKKAREIAKNKEVADKLNGKKSSEKVPTKGKTVEYKGYGVDYDLYHTKEYTVQVDGDDLMFKSYDEAKAFIDKLVSDNRK